MSAAADRPLNWNVLIVMAGLEAQAHEQLARQRPAPRSSAAACSGLTMPAPVMPRLSFASGFLLDTIPGWQHAMTCPATTSGWRSSPRPSARAGLMAAAGEAAFGLANFGQYVLSECSHPGDQAVGGPHGRRRRRGAGSRRRSTCSARSRWPTTSAPASRSRRTATPSATGRPGSSVARPAVRSSAPPTPAPTSTSSPRSTTRR